jgi:hypothetical protein
MLVYTSSDLFGNVHAYLSRDTKPERSLADADSHPPSTTFLDFPLRYPIQPTRCVSPTSQLSLHSAP